MVLLVPIIFYPLIYWGINQFLMVRSGFADSRSSEINYVIESGEYSAIVDSLKSVKNLSVIKGGYSGSEKKPIFLNVSRQDGLPRYSVHIDSSNSVHTEFWPRIELKLRNFYETEKLRLIEEKEYDPEYFRVFNIESRNTEGDHEVVVKVLSLLIPLMSVISIIASIAAASVEITSGHSEDKTSETSLTVPVKREIIIISKFITVVIYGMLAGTVNFVFLISFIMSIFKTFLDKIADDLTGFSWDQIINLRIASISLVSLLLTSFFVSVVFITASGFASKRKEGSILVSPFTAVLTYLPLVLVIPAVEPNIFIAATPVLNISFTLKLLIENNTDYLFISETVFFSILWIYLVYKFLFPFLLEEEVLLGSSGSSLTKKIKSKWSYGRNNYNKRPL
jgi:hypothetical protein